MRTPVILLVACAVVLFGAYFASRSLVSDVPASVPGTVVTLAPDTVPAVALPQGQPRPSPSRQEAEAAMLAPRQGPLQQVNAPLPVARMEPNAPLATADFAGSPFQGDSKELDYAELMLAEVNPGLERLKSAHQVFSRCVDQEPDNKRCQTGLAATQGKLGGRAAVERTPGIETLPTEAPHVRPPPPGPK